MKKLLFLLMIISMSTFIFSQERTVYGRVLDDNNNPVSGVMIELLNTSQNTFTDNMGRFHLNFPKKFAFCRKFSLRSCSRIVAARASMTDWAATNSLNYPS